ncbi:enoyl-CoA hydratase/isomerase family protein [Bordetella trematum]|uniref:enoyl-CoA hydratase/isomerase family protein n=1 Tax=Bordetella trematum TaxID=123899 RepID=UPI0039897F10
MTDDPRLKDEAILHYEEEGGIGLLRLNRPARRNALDGVLRRALAGQLQALAQDPPRVLVLAGSGGHFCVGGDIEDMRGGDVSPQESQRRLEEEYHPVLRGLAYLSCPVVAAIDGCCFGAGLSLALACDYLLCSDRARFGLPFLRLGVIPDCGALYTLPRLVGPLRAKALMLGARELSAVQAYELGLCAEVVAPERLSGRAMAVARQLAQASPVAMRGIKQALLAEHSGSLESLLAFEARTQADCRSTPHHQRAVADFLDKRPLAYGGIRHED